jgi:hypothetical protein
MLQLGGALPFDKVRIDLFLGAKVKGESTVHLL